MSRSPWSHPDAAPLQSAGVLVPLVDTGNGMVPSDEAHGTGFFVSQNGLFVSAWHVFSSNQSDDLPKERDLGQMLMGIVHAHGFIHFPVHSVRKVPGCDIAIGEVAATPDQLKYVRPMTLGAGDKLEPGRHVAVLGYPRSVTIHSTDTADGTAQSQLRMTPDYYEGQIEEYHPNGLSLVRSGAYLTNIGPHEGMPDLGGASGGPLVCCDTLTVYGLLSTSGNGYSICTDIAPLYDALGFKIPQRSGTATFSLPGPQKPDNGSTG